MAPYRCTGVMNAVEIEWLSIGTGKRYQSGPREKTMEMVLPFIPTLEMIVGGGRVGKLLEGVKKSLYRAGVRRRV